MQNGAERKQVSVFFDYGSTSCWISSSVATGLAVTSLHPTRLCGVGGKGPSVTQDASIQLFFERSVPASAALQITAGVVPDGHFPADITIGRSVFHSIGFTALQSGKVCLQHLHNKPVLQGRDSNVFATLAPVEDILSDGQFKDPARPHVLFTYPRPATNTSHLRSAAVDSHPTVATFKSSPSGSQIHDMPDPTPKPLPDLPPLSPDEESKIALYTEKLRAEFPNVFKRATRMTDSKARVTHQIVTDDASPIRIPACFWPHTKPSVSVHHASLWLLHNMQLSHWNQSRQRARYAAGVSTSPDR